MTGVEVEGHLEGHVLPGHVPVGVPLGVSDVVVAVAAGVVVVVAQQRCRDVVYARVVDEAAEEFFLVDELGEGGPPLVVVGPSVVAAAVHGPDALEGVRYAAGLIGEEAGEGQEAEGVEVINLLFR